VSHLHSLQSYTPIFHFLIVFITHFETLAENWLREFTSQKSLLQLLLKTLNRTSVTAATSQVRAVLCQITVFTTTLPRKRACCHLASSGPVVVATHGAEKKPLPLLLRSVYSVASCLPVGYLATLCGVIQQWVDMSQYNIVKRRYALSTLHFQPQL
jgi:hypothetical protein